MCVCFYLYYRIIDKEYKGSEKYCKHVVNDFVEFLKGPPVETGVYPIGICNCCQAAQYAAKRSYKRYARAIYVKDQSSKDDNVTRDTVL